MILVLRAGAYCPLSGTILRRNNNRHRAWIKTEREFVTYLKCPTCGRHFARYSDGSLRITGHRRFRIPPHLQKEPSQ